MVLVEEIVGVAVNDIQVCNRLRTPRAARRAGVLTKMVPSGVMGEWKCHCGTGRAGGQVGGKGVGDVVGDDEIENR